MTRDRTNGMTRMPMDVLRETGRSMSEWDLMRACYSHIDTDKNRRGNSARCRAVRLSLRRENGAVNFTAENNTVMWRLKP